MVPVARKFIGNTVLMSEAVRIAFGLILFLLQVSYQPAFAQFCTESSNQPVVNESFGTASQRPSLTNRTTYEYINENCPNDGQYTVLDFVDGTCFDSVWHSVPEDHTPGDLRGNMLLINGGYEAGEFYNQPVSGLCPGTSYEFSFWGINLSKPDKPNSELLPTLTARIETAAGQLVETISIGSMPVTDTAVWMRYSGLFTAPDTANQLVVHLINEKGGSGNDFGIDDIQIKQCGTCAPAPIYVPDAFTPNNDGQNDELSVFLRESTSFDMKVFNRWGSLIFTSNTLTSKWDGTYAGSPCPPGDYTWVITYQPLHKTSSAGNYVRTGHVLLLR